MNPYENVPCRPVAKEKVQVRKTLRIDRTKPVSNAVQLVEEIYPTSSEALRKYVVWAAGLVKHYFHQSELWEAMDVMERWSANPLSVSKQELDGANRLANNISKCVCQGHYWVFDKSSIAAYVVKCLTQFDTSPYIAMYYIEMAHKLDIEYSHDIIVARDNVKSSRKLAQLDYDPSLTVYQTLYSHQLVTLREKAKKVLDEYNMLFESKINEARKPQWSMFNQRIVDSLCLEFPNKGE